MAKRHKARARWLRRLYIEILGGHCEHCGTVEKLEFDCVVACGDEHHKVDMATRMNFYIEQYKQNNLQLLCTKCNSKKGDGPDKNIKNNEPF